MKIIKKGLKILHYKNGDINYKPFVVIKQGIFNYTHYVTYINRYVDVNNINTYELTDYKPNAKQFVDEEKAITYLNSAIKRYIIDYNFKHGWEIIKKETKYINE